MAVTNQQTVSLGSPGKPFTTVRGRGFGLAKATDFKADGALAYGHDIPVGRVVVTSAYYNSTPVAQQRDMLMTVSLPDVSGAHTMNPVNGLALDDASNAALLAAIKAPSGDYDVLGVAIAGEDCFMCNCSPCDQQYPACPVGNPDTYLRELVARSGSGVTVLRREGYVKIPAAEDLVRGDLLSVIDDPAGDPCVNLLGAVAKAGTGGMDLPDTWVVEAPAVAGSDVLVYIGG